jgi:hypothetical protein
VGVCWAHMDGDSRQTRNVGQQVILSAVSKVVRLGQGQLLADCDISLGAKRVSDPTDS